GGAAERGWEAQHGAPAAVGRDRAARSVATRDGEPAAQDRGLLRDGGRDGRRGVAVHVSRPRMAPAAGGASGPGQTRGARAAGPTPRLSNFCLAFARRNGLKTRVMQIRLLAGFLILL